MKKVLFALLLWLVFASPAAFGGEVNFTIKKIKLGASHKEIVKQMGKPSEPPAYGFDQCAVSDDLYLKYDNAMFYFFGDRKTDKFELVSITIVSNKIPFAPNIRIGASKAAVKAKFGKPDLPRNNPDDEVWRYDSPDKASYTVFTFKNGKLVEIHNSGILC